MHKLFISPEAGRDLSEIRRYLAKELKNPGSAKNAEFERRLQAGLANERINRYLAPLVNYSLTDDDQREEIPAENYFTTNVLYHLDFAWTITDLEIIKKMIESMNTLGFFDVN